MMQFIVRTGKIGFWVLLPLFLFSNMGVAYELPMDPAVINGNYRLRATGTFNNVLSGHIVFNEKVDSIAKGKRVTHLELKLDHAQNTSEHHMGFVISKELSGSGNLVGYYDVKAKVAGFSNNVDGVFGFADIDALGEQPFFTNNGTVHITDVVDGLLHGEVNIRLRNFEGKSIDLSGSFIATRSR